MNLFDAAAIALIVFGAAAGYRSGALPQLGGILGAIGGAAIALTAVPTLATALGDLEPLPRAVAILGAILVAVALGEAMGASIGRWFANRLGRGVLSAFDRVGGSVVGLGQAVLVLWLAGGLLAVGPLPRLAGQAEGSTIVRALDRIFPPPTEFAGEIATLLDASGLPDVFVGLEPQPLPPVATPADPVARRIAAAAVPSVVRVAAAACQGVQSGTGFAIADGYVVTNAHVVAGSRTIRVVADQPLDATPVLFNPTLDVAVLRVPGLHLAALRFASPDADRGAEGAALGHPGGGPLVTIPAAITGRYTAVGRDIYGEGRVTREILELRAAVERGDSGGPLVLADGSVGGVVFAESRTDADVGYALTASSVATVVRPAVGRTSAVPTGDCIA
ncbi:MAG: MarP family serine protease [Chloroflexota bacterium]